LKAFPSLQIDGSLKRFQMPTAEQYRAKAAAYRDFIGSPSSHAEALERRRLEQAYTMLADNEDWLARNADKITHATE
jgi:hypothetical protein